MNVGVVYDSIATKDTTLTVSGHVILALLWDFKLCVSQISVLWTAESIWHICTLAQPAWVHANLSEGFQMHKACGTPMVSALLWHLLERLMGGGGKQHGGI